MTSIPKQPEFAPDFPRITPYDQATDPRWPEAWGGDFTERDHAGVHLDRVLGQMRVPIRGAVARGLAPVNLQDYRSASQKGWGSGWPQCGGAAGSIVTVTAAVSNARFNVHRRISVLFDHLIDRMETRGYLCKPPQCGAYNCRAIGGTQTASNHSWGLAADVNWTDNPYTSGTEHTMPLWVPREIFNPYGFAWGGDYSGSKRDYMHLEFLGSPTQADEQTAKLLGEGTDRDSTPEDHQIGSRVMYLTEPHMEGDDVRALQTRLNRDYPSYSTLVIDGDFGPATGSVVREFQRRAGLTVDGEVGQATLKALHLV